jgi:MipA family protein
MLASKRAGLVLAFIGATAGMANGGEFLDGTPLSFKDTPGSYWVVTLGALGGAEPEFPGSKNFTFAFRPVIDIRREGEREWITLPNDAFSLTFFQTGNFRAGIAGDYLIHRDQSDGARGLHDINYTLELGTFAEYYPVPYIRTRVEVLQGVTGAEGLAANLSADFFFRPTPDLLLTAGPRLQFVNTQFESTFFSVSGIEAARTGLMPFHASGGLNSAGIDATARYNLTEQFSLRAFVEWDRLTGDAADSPLVKARGSDNQVQFGFGAAYKFFYGR